MPFAEVGEIIERRSSEGKPDDFYFFDGIPIREHHILSWIRKGYLSWVEEDKSLGDIFANYMEGVIHKYKTSATITGKELSQISRDQAVAVFDKARINWKELGTLKLMDHIRKALEEM